MAQEGMPPPRRSPLPFPGFVTRWRGALLVAGLLTLAGLAVSVESKAPAFIVLAATTDVRDSGLLDYLDPLFQVDGGTQVRYVAVGTGQALDLARRGDADAVLVHAPSLELPFLAEGQARCRSPLMFNHFFLVGPPSDPAHIGGLTNATAAFRRIWQSNLTFFSRADRSGTNVRELQLWALVGYTPSPKNDAWYVETGQGMAATLTIASEKGGYTLTDDATYYALEATLTLEVEVSADSLLLNVYHLMVVSPTLHPNVKYDEALAYVRWLISERGQTLIRSFTVAGHQLYTPDYVAEPPGDCVYV